MLPNRLKRLEVLLSYLKKLKQIDYLARFPIVVLSLQSFISFEVQIKTFKQFLKLHSRKTLRLRFSNTYRNTY